MSRINYPGFTLMEMLVVMSIMIILGGLGLFAFGGLRDTVIINQNLNDLKQNIQQIQQDAMLVQKSPDEGWLYGIGIDFTNFETDGTYSYFKWCSGFPEFGNVKTKSEIPGYDPNEDISDATRNGYLPVEDTRLTDCSGTTEGLSSYSGYIPGSMTLGFDFFTGQPGTPKYLLFETSTGRAFLYDQGGEIVNYDSDGELTPVLTPLTILIHRNQGKIYDGVMIMPISGEVYDAQGEEQSFVEETENGGLIPEDPGDVEVITIPRGEEIILPVGSSPDGGGILPREIDLVRDGEVIHVIPSVGM